MSTREVRLLAPLLLVVLLVAGTAAVGRALPTDDSHEFKATGSTHDRTWYAGSCTGVLRVCQDGEEPFVELGGTRHKVCNPNVMGRPTIRLSTQNWPTAMILAWIAQIIGGEQMQMPIEFSDEEPKKSTVNFFRWSHHDNLATEMWSGDAYDWPGVEYAAGNPACEGLAEGQHCAHAWLETWGSQASKAHESFLVTKLSEDGGALGMAGRIAIFTSDMAVEALRFAGYRELSRRNVTRYFQAPVMFRDFCADRSVSRGARAAEGRKDYGPRLCAFVYETLQGEARIEADLALGDSYFIETLPESVRDLAAAHGGRTWIPTAHSPIPYEGFFRPLPDDYAFVAGPGCGWNNLLKVQIAYGADDPDVPLRMRETIVNYVQLDQLVLLSGHWMTRVLNECSATDPQKWPTCPQFKPVMFWHWQVRKDKKRETDQRLTSACKQAPVNVIRPRRPLAMEICIRNLFAF